MKLLSLAKKYKLFLSLLLIFIIYIPNLGFDYVNRDDGFHVTENPLVTDSGSLKEYLLTPSTGYITTIPTLSFKLEHSLFGLNPSVHHLTNLLLHLFIVYLVYQLALLLGLSSVGAWFSSLFFGLHPLCAEPVSWISNRKSLLVSVFSLLLIISFLKKNFKPLKSIFYFGLAALSKPVVIFIAPLLLLYNLIFKSFSSRAKQVLALVFILSGALVAYAIWGQEKLDALEQPQTFALWLRDVWYALGFQLGLIFFIQDPLPIHIPKGRPAHFDFLVDFAPALLIGLLFLSKKIHNSKDFKIFLFGIAWILITIAQGVNLIPMNRYLGDTYSYFPLIGFVICLGLFFQNFYTWITPKIKKSIIGLACALLFAVMSVKTMNHALDWKNSITLWSSVEQRYPRSAETCRFLGHAFLKMELTEKALSKYKKCQESFPEEDFRKHIGISLFLLDHVSEAEELFLQLMKEGKADADVQYNLRLIKGERP